MFKEKRILYSENLQQLCIDHGWYTKGTGKEFTHLLSMTREDSNLKEQKNLTTSDIEAIAKDIIEHSSKRSLEEYYITDIMFLIANKCITIVCEM